MTWVSASAALLAAVTSIVTLVVTTLVAGRREQRKWARDSLTEAFVAFLDASWRSSDALRAHPSSPRAAAGTAGQRREAAIAAYEEMRSALTRLRLLARSETVDRGAALVRAHWAAIEAEPATLPLALDVASRGRREVIAAAKREMDLDG